MKKIQPWRCGVAEDPTLSSKLHHFGSRFSNLLPPSVNLAVFFVVSIPGYTIEVCTIVLSFDEVLK